MTTSILQLVAGTIFGLVVIRFLFGKTTPRLPPGPQGVPILGNIFDYPSSLEWIKFRDLGIAYNSDILYYNILGQSIIVLNTTEAANELFVKRSSIYSDKPRLIMLTEMVGFSWNFAFIPYGESWRDQRTVFHRAIGPPTAVAEQHPHVLQSSRNLLQHMLERPAQFADDIRLYAGQSILRIAYGIEVIDNKDPFILTAEKGMSALSTAARPGAFWVESMPFLQWVPTWIPGSGWKRWANEARKSVDAMRDAPLEYVARSIADGTAKPSLATDLLAEMEDMADSVKSREIAGNVLSTMYAAGSDTVVAAIMAGVLALVQHPDVVHKVQDELSSVVGLDRLPNFSDRDTLPYTGALLKEVLRWNPVAPLAIPHRISQDDEYRGYHIPRNSTIVGNAWAILHDRAVYGEDVEMFRPERFLTADGHLNEAIPHPSVAFGFGRRICPAQNLAEDTIWIALVSMLAVFDIKKAVDERGQVIEPSGAFQSGIINRPMPFQCSISPRSLAAEVLIGVDERVRRRS